MPGTKLSFENLNEVIQYARRLNEDGYVAQGNWSLGENCDHLAKSFAFSQSIRRTKIGALLYTIGIPHAIPLFGRLLGRMSLRAPAPAFTHPSDSISDQQGISNLEQAVRDEANLKHSRANDVVELWHCAHHLGFLLPKSAQEAPQQ